MKILSRLFSRGKVHVLNSSLTRVYVNVSFSSKKVTEFELKVRLGDVVEFGGRLTDEHTPPRPGFVAISPGAALQFRRSGKEVSNN